MKMKIVTLLSGLAPLLLVACLASPTPRQSVARTPLASPPARPPGAITGTPANTLTPRTVQAPDGRTYKQYSQPPLMAIDQNATYTATISTNMGDMTLELFASEAPLTVNNFVFLAREGLYNNVIFHRVIKGFMIQGGDPRGDGSGGPGYSFRDEPVKRSYTRGIVAMANAGPNTNGSQFFIVHGADAQLPPLYTIFGQLTAGLDTLDRLADTPVKASQSGEVSVPMETLTIKSITITQ